MPKNPRNYKEEYKEYHGKSSQIKKRAARNKARRIMKLKKGDGKEVDHKVALSKGGGNGKKNLRVITLKANRRKYNK